MINLPGNQRNDAVPSGEGAKVTKQRAQIMFWENREAKGKRRARGGGSCTWTWLIICGKLNAHSLHNLFA